MGTLSVLDVDLGAVRVFPGADVVVIQIVPVVVVAAFAYFSLVPQMALGVDSLRHTVSIFKSVVLSAGQARSVILLSLAIEVNDIIAF